MNLFDQLVIVIFNLVMRGCAPFGNEYVVLIFVHRFKCCCGYENLIDLVGISLLMSCSKYQYSVLRKSICTLISRIRLSDIGMDDLRVKSIHLGVNCNDIH